MNLLIGLIVAMAGLVQDDCEIAGKVTAFSCAKGSASADENLRAHKLAVCSLAGRLAIDVCHDGGLAAPADPEDECDAGEDALFILIAASCRGHLGDDSGLLATCYGWAEAGAANYREWCDAKRESR